MKISRHIFLLSFCFLVLSLSAYAQPGFNVDIEKPAPYQERKLKAEKTGDGKLKAPKRFLQNLTTRFNYHFNANNKLNEVLDRARENHKDDYSQLLSFYNYDLATTAADSAQLDSVIYKARTGIANHDLRNDWGDELYLLWAKAWHLEQKFDSAALMLQFINYAYAPKYEDGFYKHIGTNADGARELSIATKEENSLLNNNQVSRNNAFLWQIRTQIELDNLAAAGSLLTTLKRDPAFPKRLQNTLREIESYYHYRQQHWDSAALYLLSALEGDYPKLEKARWWYLAAQLLERAGKQEEAAALYEKVVTVTPDPVMEVFARLNTVRLRKAGGEDATDQNIAELVKMARRDKYEEYRDIIYFMAAQMELDRGNIAAANELLIKGSKFATGDQSSKNKAFLKIADASWAQKKYLQAASFYDSLEVLNLDEPDADRVTKRIEALKKVVLHSGVISRQDSLQRVAALPEEERTAYVKALVKKLRKQQGLKEEPATLSGGNVSPTLGSTPAGLFSQPKGDWYFYNTAAKAQGAAQFKAVWGNRPNVDNWRRFAAVSQQQVVLSQPDQPLNTGNGLGGSVGAEAGNPLSVEGLMASLPLTAESITASDDSVEKALFALGTAYLNDVDDLPTAIATFEELRRRFPEAEKTDEALFHLFYAYNKTGNTAGAAAAKRLLTNNHPSSRYATIVTTGKDPEPNSTASSPEATRAYENVYNLFIEGRFTEAENAKRIADSTYQTTFWQPQLLYIESVYYIRQRNDSMATTILQTIVDQNTHQALTRKALTMMDVLSRRQQIEEELRQLQLPRTDLSDSGTTQSIAYLPPAKLDSVAPPVLPVKDTALASKPVADPAKEAAALARARQKEISDSIALNNLTAKRLQDSLAAVTRDSLLAAKKKIDEARKDSLARAALIAKQRADSIALAKMQAAEARKDSLARKALADKQKADSLALAKQLAAEARRDSLARKVLADKQRADSITAARNEALARQALAAKQASDSIARVKEARERARRDSIALKEAMAKQATDSAALSRYFEKRHRDSLARITRDSLLLVKQQAEQARKDSIARKALADRQKADSLAFVKKQIEEARKDSLARAALIAKQRADSIALAKMQAAEARKDSLARKALADKQKADSLALAKQLAQEARRDSLARKALADKQRADSLAAMRKDSLAQRALAAERQRDSIAQAKAAIEQARKDSLALARAKEPVVKKPVDVDPDAYFFAPGQPHFGVVILDKVDPIFVGEAKNAFTRYNLENYHNQQLDVQIVNISADIRILVITGLPTAAAATDYIARAKVLAPTEIVPWLTGNKYSFSIISARNLELLKAKGDVPAYKLFLEKHLPGKF